MEWVQFISLMAAWIAGIGYIIKEFKSVEHDIREDIRQQSTRMDEMNKCTDRLYEMFYELLRARTHNSKD